MYTRERDSYSDPVGYVTTNKVSHVEDEKANQSGEVGICSEDTCEVRGQWKSLGI